jgi:D-sedoheptulose 7-phosphate isomerase
MATLDVLFNDSASLAEYAKRYARYLITLLSQLDHEAIERVGALLEQARQNGRTVFVIGNGGSASTASHVANDLGLGPRIFGGSAYRVVSLTDNVAFLTAAANDVGYESVFAEQLRTLMCDGDVIVAISASGNSPNILKAIEYARTRQAVTIALTGFDGGVLRTMVSECLNIATPPGDYGPVEDLHLVLGHLITSYLARLTAEANGRRVEVAELPPRPGVAGSGRPGEAA